MTIIVPANTIRIQPSPLLTPQCAPNHAPVLDVTDRSRPALQSTFPFSAKMQQAMPVTPMIITTFTPFASMRFKPPIVLQRHQYKNTGPNLKEAPVEADAEKDDLEQASPPACLADSQQFAIEDRLKHDGNEQDHHRDGQQGLEDRIVQTDRYQRATHRAQHGRDHERNG